MNFHIVYYTLYMLIMQVFCDSGRMLDSGQKKRLRSEDVTSVIYPNSGRTSRLQLTSQLRSCITALVDEHVACLTNLSVKDYA
jgi:hypothetical protein